METRAAILRSTPGTFEMATVTLEAPRQNEMLVKMVASGLCHSDEHYVEGDSHVGKLPVICGHEGSGIVLEVGPNTTGFEPGDHVVFSFIPSCGRCRWCTEGQTQLCDLGLYLQAGSRFDATDSYRVSLDGEPVGQLCGLGTFAEHTVISVDSAIKVDKDLPLDKLALLACGVGTGWGSAVYGAEAGPGDVIIIMGAGGVGMNAVQGAAHAGATYVIVADPVQFKRDTAMKLGATHTFPSIAEADAFAKSITNGQGADATVVTVGRVTGEIIGEAFESIRKGGTVVVTSIGDDTEVGIPVNLFLLTAMQKRIQGALFGMCNPRSDIPRQIEMYRNGQLKLDELITQTYRLDQVSEAYQDLLDGKNIRGIILHP